VFWSYLLHLSYNMWIDRPSPELVYAHHNALPYMRFDEPLYDDLLKAMSDGGVDMLLFDLGDAVRYESHPEIAIENAWTVERLKEELARCRAMGLEPIPKLNFSATHDAWLGPYSRMLSTPAYYEVCRDLIAEVSAIFDTPRYFHIGMDEETCPHQTHWAYVVVRQWELWWHDFQLLVDAVEKAGPRAWIWSDYVWNHPELFYEKMPKQVLQSNWFYDETLDPEAPMVKPYIELDQHGYDQAPTGSNHSNDVNFENTVRFAKERMSPERLLGFMQTPWRITLEEMRQRHMNAIDQVTRARNWFEK